MIEVLLLICVGYLIGRVLIEFHQEHFDLGLTKYRVSVEQYNNRNKQ